MSVSDTVAGLVEAAQAGDRDAFAALVRLHWSMLVRLARSVVGETEAEDVAQEASVVAWRKLGGLADPVTFPRWIARIVFRRSLRRARRRRSDVALDAVDDPGHTPDVEGEIYVWQVLSRLAPRQRAVLHLTVVEGMADSEIGATLGIRASSVRVHRMRAREQAAKVIGGETHHDREG